MPSLDELFSPQDISPEALRAYQEAMANAPQPEWIVRPMRYDMDSMMEILGTPARRSLAQRREWEKEQLERLIRTGRSELTLGLCEDQLVVKGETINTRKTMFILSKTTLTAWARRTRHLTELLARLAELEGVKLVLQEEILGTTNETTIRYWQFRHDLDDTELFRAKLAAQPIRQENPYQDVDEPDDEEDYDDD